ncbi:MAG: hypothetical protein QW733_07280 [Desulfurococcaceae archaeon]
MGIKYICGSCGHVIYEFKKVGSSVGLLSPMEVAKLHGYVCPVCKSQLNVPSTANFRSHIQIRVRMPQFTLLHHTVVQQATVASKH